ncbi:hypothetical protein [Pendulispora albinea]|uniref:Uncharacterized protein n=1 Tax=Pendulispora albinea TaxID=2741071 RepID=A0ABZ2LP00_9BACT
MDISTRQKSVWVAGLETHSCEARSTSRAFVFPWQREIEDYYGRFESEIGFHSTFPDLSQVTARRSRTRGVWVATSQGFSPEVEERMCRCADSNVVRRANLVYAALSRVARRAPRLESVLWLLYGASDPTAPYQAFGVLAPIVCLTDAVEDARRRLVRGVIAGICVYSDIPNVQSVTVSQVERTIGARDTIKWYLAARQLRKGHSWAEHETVSPIPTRRQFISNGRVDAEQLRLDAMLEYCGARAKIAASRQV